MYKRYMVFEWSEYDNVAPFDCLDIDCDNLTEAKNRADLNIRDGYCSCVFDRIEGVMIKVNSV